MRSIAGFCLGLSALCATPACAQVFGGLSSNGTVVLSNFRRSETPAVVVPASGASASDSAALSEGDALAARIRAQAYNAIVREIAQEVDVPARLLHAVIAVESAYLPNAVSPKGAQGLMQLMPATAQRFGVADPFDPRDNVRGGARYLKWLLERFEGDLSLAIAGYNAGEEAVIRAGYRIPSYAETRRYVPRVMARLQKPATT